MTRLINSLTWQAQSDAAAPLAPETINFALDNNWQFTNLQGMYFDREIFPKGVVVDNSQNNALVIIAFGPNLASVQPFQRATFKFPRSTQSIVFQCTSPVTVNLQFFIDPTSADVLNQAAIQQQGIQVIRSYIAGLEMSPAGAVMAISAGQATDMTNVAMMDFVAFTKTVAAWSVGGGGGGLDVGATAAPNTTYHWYGIMNVLTLATDFVFSLNPNLPTIPTGFTLSRRIGSRLTDGAGNWRPATQSGDDVWTAVNAAFVFGGVTPMALVTLPGLPTGIVTTPKLQWLTNSLGGNPGQISIAPASDLTQVHLITEFAYNDASGGSIRGTSEGVPSNTLGQIGIACLAFFTAGSVAAYGWRDLRGKDL